jgi:formate hydrogenlyase subunit 3/multisubunit Na+/H+ antiporter MnhD subunit
MVAYALIADFGVTLFAIGSNQPGALHIVLFHVGVRVVSLAAWGLGAAVMGRTASERHLIGAGRVNPIAASASLIGALGLAGFPLTGGFAIRWALLRSLPASADAGVLILLLSMLLVTLAVGRWAAQIFSSAGERGAGLVTGTDRWILLAGILLCLLLGGFPQLGMPWVAPALRGFANLHH